MATVFESAVANNLKLTLNSIIDDDTDGYFESMDLHDWCEEDDMSDAWYDDLEMGGPGLAVEVPEGTPVPMGSLREGVLTRYVARKFGLKMGVTEEAMDDSKYANQSLKIARRLKRALAKTADIDATNILNRAFNSSYVGGDSVSLGSASHTLPNGGTFSNIMTTPMSPSTAAVGVARAACRVMPGHDGVREGYQLETVLCPVEQESAWETICYSKIDPAAGNFGAINVVKDRIGLKMKVLKFWNASSTNYGFLTDCTEERPRFYWRKRPTSRTWVENSNEVMLYSTTARWARGWSGARGFFGVNA